MTVTTSPIPKVLDHKQLHLIRLVAKGVQHDGWTPVSTVLVPVVQEFIPVLFVELEKDPRTVEDKWRARLTEQGKQLYWAMQYLLPRPG